MNCRNLKMNRLLTILIIVTTKTTQIMKSINISIKKIIICCIFLILLLSLYLIWGKLTSPYGVQKVSFIPSKSEKFTKGKLSFVIYRASNGVNQDIIYHFHGRNIDNTIWYDDTYFTSLIQSYWQKSNIKPPTVVVISYGPEWLLTPKNSMIKSGLMNDFLSNLPLIESKTGKPKNRILLG